MATRSFTSTEFRNRPALVFDLADNGEKVIIRRNRKAYKLEPVEEENTISPALQAELDKARREIEAGDCITLNSVEDINRYFENL